MKLIACLAWYDEPVRALQELVRSLAGVCDRLVALDGAYALYPNGAATSAPSQAEAIADTAAAVRLPFEVHAPGAPFAGNEVEKRTRLMQLACARAEVGRDWLLVVDGDMRVRYHRPELRTVLAGLQEDVADYWLTWSAGLHQSPSTGERGAGCPARLLFRALPGLRVDGAHYVYVADRDGRKVYLRGREEFHPVEPAATVEDLLHVEHLTVLRPRERHMAAAAYYERRDTEAIESVRHAALR